MVIKGKTKSAPFWCRAEATQLVYTGPIRDGKFGSLTTNSFEVWEIKRLRLGFLQPFPAVEYTDGSYRLAVNDACSIEQYFQLHAHQQPGYFKLIQGTLWPGMTVVDCGCGGGALLDLVKATTAGATLAVEPFDGYHRSLGERGHEVFPSISEALKQGRVGAADLAISFHVIEHVIDPLAFLKELRKLVRPGGLAVILTPNWDDILLRLDPARMAPFFYRRVHNYYFTAHALTTLSELAGWTVKKNIFYHEFGLSNALLWLRDGRPAGHLAVPEITTELDDQWRHHLMNNGNTNNVGIVLQNGESKNL